MKLCIVTETFPPEVNGVAMTLSRICSTLRDKGHEVTIVRPHQGKTEPEPTPTGETTVPSMPLIGYDGLHIGLPCRRKLRSLWAADKPDVIYAATEGPLGQSAIRAAKDLEITVTSGFHTNFDQYMKHYKLPLLEKAMGGFLRMVHNRTRRTFAPSQDVIARLDEIGIENTRLLERGVDGALFNPAHRDAELRRSWGIDPETGIAAVYVSRIAAEKNIPLLLRAFESVRARHPEAACVLVGDGPERAKLEKAHPDLIFAGMQQGEALSRHYASGDLFLFPSVTETFGNVVTEALASGLVVVAYDYAAPRRFIRDGENGFIAQFDDDRAYLLKVEEALDREAEWPGIRGRARAVTESITWSAIVDGFAAELEAARAEG